MSGYTRLLNSKASFTSTVAFDDGSVSSGPCLLQTSSGSRQCIACAHKAKLRNGTAPAELRLDPAALKPEPVKKETETWKGYSEPAVLEAGCQTERWTGSPALEVRPDGKLTDMAVIKPDSGVREALEDRDPNNLNQHVQIVWDDIIGEPEGARSPECAWRVSNVCFKHARNWCYTLLAVLIAPPCALLLGCGFACLAFEQIWCTAPCLRCVKIYFASLRTMVQSCMAATVVPTAEAVGHVCRHIRVNFRRDAAEERDMLVV